MIREVTWDVLLSDGQMIAHGVSSDALVFGRKAPPLRQRLQGSTKHFRGSAQQSKRKPPEIVVRARNDEKKIVSLHRLNSAETEGSRPQRAKIGHFNRCLQNLREFGIEDRTPGALGKWTSREGAVLWSEVKPVAEMPLGDPMVPMDEYEPFASVHAAGERQ